MRRPLLPLRGISETEAGLGLQKYVVDYVIDVAFTVDGKHNNTSKRHKWLDHIVREIKRHTSGIMQEEMTFSTGMTVTSLQGPCPTEVHRGHA